MGSRKSNGQKKVLTAMTIYKSNEAALLMECSSQPLSEVQIEVKKKAEDEFNQFVKKLNENISKRGGEIIEQGTHVTVYEIDCSPIFPPVIIPPDLSSIVSNASTGLIKPAPTSTLLATTQSNVSSLIPNSGVLLQSGAVASSGSTVFTGQPTTYQLVVGPRMGLIVTPSSPASASTIQTAANVNSTISPMTAPRPTTTPRVQVRPNLGNVISQGKRFITTTTPKISVNPATQKNTPSMTKVTSPASGKVVTSIKSGTNTPNKTATSAPVPTPTINTRSKMKQASKSAESNVIETPPPPPLPPPPPPPPAPSSKTGANSAAVVDLTDDDGKTVADSREVSFNRYPGRIYPSLVVVARPNIKVKDMTSTMITAERTQLDTKVKGILTNSPTKFTEWLIQQGLVRSEQVCNLHVNVDMTPIKLKLGMYSDVSKFPYSGGYVWISDCCPQKFVSVFCNSVFEGAPHAPTVLLKLMYHWSCQTNVHNIISWVKVDNLYIKNFFTNLRAICTAAICEKFGKLGGPSKKIEVGVISLGTTSQNGSVRQVKVEVLGIMDPVTKFVRLRAVEPVQNAEKNHKLRFSRILESLELWVDKRTTIITDYTVDKGTLNELGFHSVIQVQLNSNQTRDTNQAVMEYLKRVVPRMFQNTLSLLSRSIIQQFLDELVWRERWGPISSRAFDNLILHLSEMTKLDTGDTLINRLKNITANPFKDWSYKNWKTNSSVAAVNKKGESGDDANTTVNKPNQKIINMALRPKPGSASAPKSTKGAPKSSTITLTIDDSSDDGLIVPSIDNLPPSITEVEDDNMSVSSNSSRRSRTRNSIEEKVNGSTRWDPQLILKSLEGFYYGTLPSDVVVINKLRKVELNMKCFTCGHTYNNNILFMKHLAGHAQNEGAFTTDYQCRYCFRNFTTAFDLEDHLGTVHFPNKYNSMCLICGERFRNRGCLVTHMQTTHVELELPYQCTICKFRVSEHTKLIDHFYEVHDGGEKVQCPYCLKIVAFESSNKVKLTQNVNFYFNHIKRHQKKPIRKCPKCVLTFVNKNLLKDHLTKDHNSCLNIPGIIRYQGSDFGTVLMPLPSIAPPLTRKGKPQQALPVPNFSTYKLDTIAVFPKMPSIKCLECKTEVNVDQHFTSYMTCMKCMFASCCKVVMTRHMDKMHESKNKKKVPIKRKILLGKPLHCICGFSSTDGNAMASHLVHCKRKIAYPSPERAAQYSVQMQSASFPPLVNLDDVEQDPDEASDKWLRAFVKPPENEEKPKKTPISEKSPPRMLKVLGLVCKESSTEGENIDKTKQENDIPAKRTRSSNDLLKSQKRRKIESKEQPKPLKSIEIIDESEKENLQSKNNQNENGNSGKSVSDDKSDEKIDDVENISEDFEAVSKKVNESVETTKTNAEFVPMEVEEETEKGNSGETDAVRMEIDSVPMETDSVSMETDSVAMETEEESSKKADDGDGKSNTEKNTKNDSNEILDRSNEMISDEAIKNVDSSNEIVENDSNNTAVDNEIETVSDESNKVCSADSNEIVDADLNEIVNDDSNNIVNDDSNKVIDDDPDKNVDNITNVTIDERIDDNVNEN